MECPICCTNPLTNGKSKSITCPSCEYIACTKCIMTAMNVSKKVECINCRVGFTTHFIHSAFTKKGRIEIDKIHVDKIFKKQLDMARLEKPLIPLYKERDRLNNQYDIAIDSGMDDDDIADIYEPLIDAVNDKIDNLKGLLYDDNEKSRCIGCKEGIVFENRTQCQLCNTDHCLKCGKENLDLHECLVEDLETLRAVKECSKKCPNCLVWISKVEGCDQMFCIECKTPFEWISGKVIKSDFFHNPHYENYLENGGRGVFEDRNGDDDDDVEPNGDCFLSLLDFNEGIESTGKEYVRLHDIYKETERFIRLFRFDIVNEEHCNDSYNDSRHDFIMQEINERQFYQNIYYAYITLKEIEVTREFLATIIYTLAELLNAIFQDDLSASKGLSTIELFIRLYIKPEFKKISKMHNAGSMSIYRWSIR